MAHSAEVVQMPVTVKATERTLTFNGAGGVQLEGSLMMPAGELKGTRPSVLLLTTGERTDRDGNHLGTKTDTLKQIAKGLAAAGICSFRFDKRTVKMSVAQWPKDPAKVAEFYSWKNQVADAVAAWKAMKADGAIDPENCAILGHSEGGLMLLAMVEVARPKAIVLVGTPGRKMATVLDERLKRQLGHLGAGDELLATNRSILQQISQTGRVPNDVPKVLKPLYTPSFGLYLKELCEVDPVKLAKRVTPPALVLNGGEDIEVSPTKDAQALFEALPRSDKNKLMILPLASHNLKPVERPGEQGVDGEVVPDAVEAIQEFLVELIGGRVPDHQSSVH